MNYTDITEATSAACANSTRVMDAKLPQIPVSSQVKTIKAHLEKAKQAEERSEQHYISAGLHLAELKDRYKRDVKASKFEKWDGYIRKTFGLGRSRADELIRIASGKATVAETRANTAKRVQKHSSMKKSPLANGGSGKRSVTVFAGAPTPAPASPQKQLEALSLELENFSSDYCARVREWHEARPNNHQYIPRLVGMLEQAAQRLQKLAEDIDGRTAVDNWRASVAAKDQAPRAPAGPPVSDGLDIPSFLKREA
jgi:hypothetical protein